MFLDEVIAATRLRCASLPGERSLDGCPPVRSLHGAIRACNVRAAIIAEIKPASPTNARFRRIEDPGALAGELAGAGACAISVLTEPVFFGGSPDSLGRVRDAVGCP